MSPKNRKDILPSIILKICALVIGYAIWHVFSQAQTITITHTVPVCFDNQSDKQIIKGPETVTVSLQGKREAFRTIDLNLLAAHINIARLSAQQSRIHLLCSHLFLPEHILLVDYSPAPIVVEMSEENEIKQEQQGVNV